MSSTYGPIQGAIPYGPPDLTVSVAAQPSVLYDGPSLANPGTYDTAQITVRVDNRLTARPMRLPGGTAYYGSQANGVTVRIAIGKDSRLQASIITRTATSNAASRRKPSRAQTACSPPAPAARFGST